MSTDRFGLPDPFDPELRELLREIAARQESQLLRPRSARNVRELLGEGEWTRAGATGLSSAERHLLTRYREEAAFLLRELAHERLRASPRFRRVLCPPDRRATRPRDRQELVQRLEKEAYALSAGFEWHGRDPDLIGAMQLVRRPRMSASALARSSLKLVPSFDARMCLAADLVRNGSLQAALAAYARISQLAPLPSHRIHALAWSGVVHGRCGDFDAAVDAHRSCAEARPEEPVHSWNWLAYAVQTGSAGECLAAIEFVDRQASQDDTGLDQWLENSVAQREHGEWDLTALAASCASRVVSRTGSRAGRILDVFQ